MPPNENEPEVTPETKFEVRGFRTEPPEGEEAVGGMPDDGQEMIVDDPDAMAAQIQAGGEADAGSGGEPARKEAKIKIGTREFDNQEEAFAYAQELELKSVADDAFRQGIEVATKGSKGNTEAAPPPPEDDLEGFETEYFEDPKGFLKKYGEKIAEKVTRQLHQQNETRSKNEQTWSKFKATYPDLAGSDEFSDVQTYIFKPENWANLKHMDTDKALKIAAEAVREKYSRIIKNKLPGVDLKQSKTPTSPGNGINVTPAKTEEKALNFVQQTRQLRAKRAARPMRR